MTKHIARVGRDLSAEERRDLVIRAALRVLSTSSYDTIRLLDIAREANVSVGVLQHHFETRENLLSRALSFVSDELLESFAEVVANAKTPWLRITGLVERLFQLPDVEAHCRVFMEFVAASTRHEQPRERLVVVYEAWRNYLEDAIQQGIDSGEFQPLLPKADIAGVLMAVLDGSQVALATRVGNRSPSLTSELVVDLSRNLLGYDDLSCDLSLAARTAAMTQDG